MLPQALPPYLCTDCKVLLAMQWGPAAESMTLAQICCAAHICAVYTLQEAKT